VTQANVQRVAAPEPPRRPGNFAQHAKIKINPPLMPLIDVMFTLLMFFLVAGQLRGEGAIPSNLPDILGAGPSSIKFKITPIRVAVHAAGENASTAYYQIEGSQQQWNAPEGLFQYLASFAEKDDPGKVPVIIRPYGPVRWEFVVNAFNQAVRAKYKQVGFAPSLPGS
jgi:biopolymer transport protein ExbD